MSTTCINAQYAEVIEMLIHQEAKRPDRTKTGTSSIFGVRNIYNLKDGLPIITLKKVHLKSIIHELLWMISGSTNIKYLNDNGVTIWDEWADSNGELGPVYGSQWRNFNGEGVDQIKELEYELKNNPHSRRLILSAWNPAQTKKMALPPCHMFAQFYVDEGELSCQMYQRSADMFLGVPFNMVQYAVLTQMLAKVCGYGVGYLHHIIGDAHLYSNHVEQAKKMISRGWTNTEEGQPLSRPTLLLPNKESITDYVYDDFMWQGNYIHHPHIAAPVAV